jgi:hypothetical protein
MNQKFIRGAFLLSIVSTTLFGVTLFATYYLTSYIFAYISLFFITSGTVMFIFGVVTPILTQYLYENIISDRARLQLASFRIWRFILNLNSKQGDGK